MTSTNYASAELMFQLLYPLIHAFQPVVTSLFLITAWAFVVLLMWTIGIAARDGIVTVKRLHQIPCANCQYFTGDYILKCTVRPTSALTESAINCSDFCQSNSTV
jgi:hypothetical protein